MSRIYKIGKQIGELGGGLNTNMHVCLAFKLEMMEFQTNLAECQGNGGEPCLRETIMMIAISSINQHGEGREMRSGTN